MSSSTFRKPGCCESWRTWHEVRSPHSPPRRVGYHNDLRRALLRRLRTHRRESHLICTPSASGRSWTPARARLVSTVLGAERDLEEWIERDPALLERGLVIVGRQIWLEWRAAGPAALDPQGRWVLIEIKRGDCGERSSRRPSTTPRACTELIRTGCGSSATPICGAGAAEARLSAPEQPRPHAGVARQTAARS